MLDSLEALFPCANLKLDGLPFCELDFAEHVALDYDYFIELVNLRINDLVLDCVDSPRLNLFHIDIEELGEVSEGEVGHLGVKSANLHIGLLDNKFLFC